MEEVTPNPPPPPPTPIPKWGGWRLEETGSKFFSINVLVFNVLQVNVKYKPLIFSR